jgi:metallo-beta-lactamase family protein
MENKSLAVTFVHGARTVTGSNFLVEAKEGKTTTRILIDCGLTQGENFCDPANNEKFPYDPTTIDALFVTHAHADHIGLVPKLVEAGFAGPIYATAPTIALMPIMLDDTAFHITDEAQRCNTEPPYTQKDVSAILPYLSALEYHRAVSVGPITVTLYNAGHILGSATVMVEVFGTHILFTGDLGRVPAILVPDREVPPGPIDYLVTESVYGDRVHEGADESERVLRGAVARAQKEKGTLLIPSFSLERTQIIMTDLGESPIPVHLDSPLAEKVTEVYRRFPQYLKTPLAAFPSGKPIGSGPEVIVAGAGMSSGGRIRGYEKKYLPDKHATLLIVGYQVPGSLGRRLQDGARKVNIDGEYVTVRAKVMSTGGFSAHADRDDLLKFAEDVKPREAFVVLGEMSAATFLAQRLSGFLGIKATIPQQGERYELEIKKPV